jgi:hypothetical protein
LSGFCELWWCQKKNKQNREYRIVNITHQHAFFLFSPVRWAIDGNFSTLTASHSRRIAKARIGVIMFTSTRTSGFFVVEAVIFWFTAFCAYLVTVHFLNKNQRLFWERKRKNGSQEESSCL